MKTSLLFIVFIISVDICGLSSSLVNSQTDSCSSNLDLSGSVPFNTTALRCQSVWASQDFILRYSQAASNIWSFVLSTPVNNSYIAIGFSTDGAMVGSSAVVGWIPSGGTGVVKQYHLGGTSPNLVVPDQGDLQLVNGSTAIISQSSRSYLAFQLETTQPRSQLLYSIGPADWFPTSTNALIQHRLMVSTSINYATGQSASTGTPYQSLRRGHGILNMLGWGILLIVGAIAARYFREKDPTWFYFHAGIQSLGFILGVIGVITGFVLYGHLKADVGTHRGIGIFILVLGVLQVMALLARPSKTSKVRKYWNWYHQNGGRILVIFAIANIFYGIHLGGEGRGWSAGYGVVLAVLFIIAIVLEVRIWIRK